MTILTATRDLLARTWRRLPIDRKLRVWMLSIVPGILRNPPRGLLPDTFQPNPLRPGQTDCFVFGVIDWHYRFQRPQHLARELVSAGFRVFYVSSNLVSSNRPGFRVEPLDENGQLYQVFLNLNGVRAIYHATACEPQQTQLNQGVRALFDWAHAQIPILFLQHPFWNGVIDAIPSARVVYDCMDYHEGFGTFEPAMAAAEHALMARADLVTVSSAVLDRRVAPYAKARALIRNGADFAHFSQPPKSVFRDRKGRRVLGYYGAIAAWFDLDLVDAVARRFSDCVILLIGHDQIAAAERLGRFNNVQFIGEVPYQELPRYLHGFDVCLVPFLVNELTLATNPVKVYEYLSAGKAVVSVNLPELMEFEGLVATAVSRESFLDAVAVALGSSDDAPTVARRRAFAARQSWEDRGRRLISALAATPTPVGHCQAQAVARKHRIFGP